MSGTNPEKPPIQPEQQLYPPPPGDSNTNYQQQQQQQQQPPQYTSGGTQYNPDQKSELPGSHPGQSQHFPPPPPGPPPANQPQFTHAPQPQQHTYNQTSQQQQHSQTPLGQHAPGYNPADHAAGHHYAQFDGPPGSAAPGHPQGGPYADPAAAHAAYVAPVTTDPAKEKKGWSERLSQIGMKAAVPINALANKMGSQSFLPTTMDKECEKAAKILRSFCKEGITSEVTPQTQTEHLEPGKHADSARPTTPGKEKVRKEQKAIVKIPSKVINKAVGLAIFTTARAGFNFSGATGSGVLISRLPDGSWSPPSGIQVHALGAGFMIGIDIYDCVCVINSREALAAFTGTRVSLGSDIAVVAGPYGAGGVMDVGASFGGKSATEDKQPAADAAKPVDDGKLKPDEKQKRRSSSSSIKPVFSYVKSRGFYAGIQVDGTVVTERKDANAAFYGQKVAVDQIIKGQVPPQGPAGMWPTGAQALYEALRTAEQQQALPEVHLPQATPGQVPPQGSIPPQQQYSHPEGGGPLGSHPSGQGPTASGALNRGEQLPGYVDDGVSRPGVGDNKSHYQ